MFDDHCFFNISHILIMRTYSNLTGLKQLLRPTFIEEHHPHEIMDILYNLLKQKYKNDTQLLKHMFYD